MQWYYDYLLFFIQETNYEEAWECAILICLINFKEVYGYNMKMLATNQKIFGWQKNVAGEKKKQKFKGWKRRKERKDIKKT